MKKVDIKQASFLLCALVSLSINADCNVTSYFSPRSQGVDLVRQFVGVRDIMEDLQCSDECWPGYVGSVTEFTDSFRSLNISRCLFGPSLLGNGHCQALKISGSNVANRNDTDLLADYFGLPTDFQSVINFNPRIVNVIGDLQGYFRLDRWLCGLYFYIHLPVTTSKWNLHVCEDIIAPGSSPYSEGYFGPGSIARSNLLNSFSEFISGRDVPNLSGTEVFENTSFSETFNALKFSRWATHPCGSRSKTGLADLRFWLGYDWINCEKYGFGIGAVIAAPTGNAPNGRYLFEPIIGNGHHWEFGGLIKGDYLFWQHCDGSHRITGFTQANFTHLFNAKQVRTFDLCNRPLSRYMLAEKLGPNSSPLLYGSLEQGAEDPTNPTLSNYKFANEYTPVANLTTFCVNVSTNIQIDWLAMLTYSHCNFTWDVGYNLWYRGCEKIKFDCDTENLIAKNTWALKGDAYVFGFAQETNSNLPIDVHQPVALGATESNATIYSGTNLGMTNPNLNPGIDAPQFAYAGNAAADVFMVLDANTSGAGQTRTSIQPVFLSGNNLDICSSQTKGYSNKLFTHISYAWDCECWQPFFGAGAMGEFGAGDNRCNNNNNCDDRKDCRICSLSQWGIWLKGGFVF